MGFFQSDPFKTDGVLRESRVTTPGKNITRHLYPPLQLEGMERGDLLKCLNLTLHYFPKKSNNNRYNVFSALIYNSN